MVGKERLDEIHNLLSGCVFKEIRESCIILEKPDGKEVILSSDHEVWGYSDAASEDWLHLEIDGKSIDIRDF